MTQNIPNEHFAKGAEWNGYRIVAQKRYTLEARHHHLYIVLGAHKQDHKFFTAVFNAKNGEYNQVIPTSDVVEAANDFKNRSWDG